MRTFDIINAGPNNRFMANGKIVSNSGRDAQLQNLPKPTKEVEKKMDRAVELVRKADYEAIIAEFSQPLDVITSTVRSSFRAPDGHNLVVVDLASIESRVVGAAARCEPMLDIFRQGLDPYITFAARMFNKPYDEVTKEERTKAKAPVLGCSYGLGGGEEQTTADGDIVRSGLWGYAAGMNIELTQEESAQAVSVFREMYPQVPKFWKDLEEAAIAAVRNPGKEFRVGVVSFVTTDNVVLGLNLPSGRALSYLRPKVETQTFEGKRGPYQRPRLTYEGREQGTRAWSRISTGGPKICENLVQAIARDILINGMIEADKAGLTVVGHVHDEILALVTKDSGLTEDDLVRCMTSRPPWLSFDLPLDAQGYSATYYRKD